ncbi:MAG: sigma 54-interacting transcriptional regulator [Desulfobacterales bacterium]|nr:sigma 54-interacting transcriptional regulator [Desulfobacterales bacterium]
MNILLTWLGTTDYRTACGLNKEKNIRGPILQALSEREFSHVYILGYTKKEENLKEDIINKIEILKNQNIGKKIKEDCSNETQNTKEGNIFFADWLKDELKKIDKTIKVDISNIGNIESVDDSKGIYDAVKELLKRVYEEHGKSNCNITFHLSPGTQAMGFVWAFTALSTNDNIKLIAISNKDVGVKDVEPPFKLSVEYVSKRSKKEEEEYARLIQGLPDISSFNDIKHQCREMKECVNEARWYALQTEPVLIFGETGTGKELFARAIHNASDRKNKKFIAVNCGAIPDNLIEAELFGYEKGAFTGATSMKKGKFEEANDGTIFLDEIGELRKDIQVKLLRPLNDGIITRIGSNKEIRLNVRIVSATNRDLNLDVSEGNFREDLFYRIAGGVIKLPPIKERKGDIGILIDNVLETINNKYKKNKDWEKKELTSEARNFIINEYDWPGNYRELQSVITRACRYSSQKYIELNDIKKKIVETSVYKDKFNSILDKPLDDSFDIEQIIEKVEEFYVKKALIKTNNMPTKAANLLKMNRPKFNKIKKNLDSEKEVS